LSYKVVNSFLENLKATSQKPSKPKSVMSFIKKFMRLFGVGSKFKVRSVFTEESNGNMHEIKFIEYRQKQRERSTEEIRSDIESEGYAFAEESDMSLLSETTQKLPIAFSISSVISEKDIWTLHIYGYKNIYRSLKKEEPVIPIRPHNLIAVIDKSVACSKVKQTSTNRSKILPASS
jgi:hypothetical protein